MERVSETSGLCAHGASNRVRSKAPICDSVKSAKYGELKHGDPRRRVSQGALWPHGAPCCSQGALYCDCAGWGIKSD
jgi:hypothetical protein